MPAGGRPLPRNSGAGPCGCRAIGVAGNEISIQAVGVTYLLVPTGPDMREPQNRRVEILLN